MYKCPSPAQSSTSLSDIEDEDFNKSTFFPSDPVAVTPAQWSSRHQHFSNPPNDLSISAISYASRLPPEILIHVLKHLHSSRDLYHALLVCRAWCECSVELLWHRPSFSKLSTLGKMIRIFSRENQTFVYARFIRRLNFLYLGSDLTDSLFSRLAQCVRLERLTLINCSSLTDGALARVLPCCPNLVALDLTGVAETTDRAMVALASSTKRLQGINLGGCKKLTDHGILALAANCPLLRRVKLSHVEQVTDAAISALAKSCPLLLEIDLNNCKKITDSSVRDLWLHSNHMREMRLSHCAELTDNAFPASPRTEAFTTGFPNPFTSTDSQMYDKLPPLRLPRPFEHLRMLDLTGCSNLTDEAIEGIVSVAPKIRNLVLAKCTQLTDNAVESICTLGKHLHYLHLGHAGSITDRSIRLLARACTRLRYIDLANCLQLTDMSVFELASLQKLRRIGLVRVNNLTDQAIYSLAERHSTLERIHLSYCDQITVLAVHYLLQKLPKLTHLSLTGIPAFRRPELQQFCRDPPAEFNPGQRAAFCVYSGKGVVELRDFLNGLFKTIHDEISPGDGTEYEEGFEEDYRDPYPDDMEVFNDGDDDEDEVPESRQRIIVSRGGYRTRPHIIVPETTYMPIQPVARELLMTRDRGSQPIPRNNAPSPQGWTGGATPIAIVPTRRGRGFGHQPIVEASTSPTPSDVASNRSTGTNRSNGAGFFRNYTEASTSTALRQGVMTPDLIFAEIGHGRGADSTSSSATVFIPMPTRQSLDPLVIDLPSTSSTYTVPIGTASTSRTQLTSQWSAAHPGSARRFQEGSSRSIREQERGYVLTDTSNSYQHNDHAQSHPDLTTGWASGRRSRGARSLSSSPTTRELHESLGSILAARQTRDTRDHHTYEEHQQPEFSDVSSMAEYVQDARGRSVKRSLRNTISAAEQYARPSGSRDGDPHGH
ncbi:hypothetical protein ABKN59_000621 [Abortiporus biennis]